MKTLTNKNLKIRYIITLSLLIIGLTILVYGIVYPYIIGFSPKFKELNNDSVRAKIEGMEIKSPQDIFYATRLLIESSQLYVRIENNRNTALNLGFALMMIALFMACYTRIDILDDKLKFFLKNKK